MSLMALMMLFISACFSDAEIAVKNNSSEEAWVRLDYGSRRYINPGKTLYLPSSSFQVVNLSYEGVHILAGDIQIELDSSGTRHVSLEANCGSLRLHNSSLREIRSLQIAPAGTNSYSANLLDFFLRTGESDVFRLSPGFYDLRIRDDHNNVYYLTAIPIVLDQRSSRVFTAATH